MYIYLSTIYIYAPEICENAPKKQGNSKSWSTRNVFRNQNMTNGNKNAQTIISPVKTGIGPRGWDILGDGWGYGILEIFMENDIFVLIVGLMHLWDRPTLSYIGWCGFCPLFIAWSLWWHRFDVYELDSVFFGHKENDVLVIVLSWWRYFIFCYICGSFSTLCYIGRGWAFSQFIAWSCWRHEIGDSELDSVILVHKECDAFAKVHSLEEMFHFVTDDV